MTIVLLEHHGRSSPPKMFVPKHCIQTLTSNFKSSYFLIRDMVDMVVHHMFLRMHMDMVLVQVLMPILMLIHMLMDMVVVEFVKRVKYVIISDEQVCKCDN